MIVPVGVLAVDDARLVRMQLQTDRRQPLREAIPHLAGLILTLMPRAQYVARGGRNPAPEVTMLGHV